MNPSEQSLSSGGDSNRDPVSGKFLPDNTANLRHGRRSRAFQERLREQAAEALAAKRAVILDDLGGPVAVGEIASDMVDDYIAAQALLEWMQGELLTKGVITARGRRRQLHSAYLQQLSQVAKLASMLGLAKDPPRDIQ